MFPKISRDFNLWVSQRCFLRGFKTFRGFSEGSWSPESLKGSGGQKSFIIAFKAFQGISRYFSGQQFKLRENFFKASKTFQNVFKEFKTILCEFHGVSDGFQGISSRFERCWARWKTTRVSAGFLRGFRQI